MILVHGYANSQLDVGRNALQSKGQQDNSWYWEGKYSDNIEEYHVKDMLENAARADGAQMQVKFANWDGRSTIQDAVETLNPQESGLYSLIDLLDEYCSGSGTCDLVGHSTGDALIGYVLDQYADNPNHHWNIGTVFVAGGAGGGTEAASEDQAVPYFHSRDPVIAQLRPVEMRKLYNHDMRGQFAAIPNIRFVGAGTKTDLAHPSRNSITGAVYDNIPYATIAQGVRGQSDGLVPFHSQGGVRDLVGSPGNQAYDAYCIQKHTGAIYSCGQLNLGSGPAQRWGYIRYTDVALFNGFQVQMIDAGLLYNHSDEVGRLAEWIIHYKQDPRPWYSSSPIKIAAAVVPGTEVLQLFYRGWDYGVWSRWRTPDGLWPDEQSLGGILTSDITAAVEPHDGVLQLFYRGQDGGVWSRWRNPDGSWSDEQSLGGRILA